MSDCSYANHKCLFAAVSKVLQLESLKDRLLGQQQQIEEQDTHTAGVQQALSQSQTQNQRLGEQVKVLTSKDTAHQLHVKSLHQKLSEQQSKVVSAAESTSNVKMQLSEQQQAVSALQLEVHRANEQAAAANASRSHVQHHLDTIKQQSLEKEASLTSMADQLDALTSDVAAKASNIQLLQQQVIMQDVQCCNTAHIKLLRFHTCCLLALAAKLATLICLPAAAQSQS